MKRILFIIPSLGTGGTNSSLDSFYTQFKDKYHITVFSIAHQPRNHNYSFDEALLKQDVILSLLCAKFSDQRGVYRVFAFFFKVLQSLLRKMNINLATVYGKRVVNRIESTQKYDFVVGFQEGFATTFASMFQKPDKIAWIHCNYNFYLPLGKSEEKMYDKFNKIVCVSKYTASVFANRYPTLSSKTIFIHNLIDSNRIKELSQISITDADFSADCINLISVGRFSTVKRFREIPIIAQTLKNRGLKFVWYILGPADETGESELFTENMQKYSVQDCVKWLGGKSNPYPYFKKADIYVCLSESEACPMVFKEAKIFGLPIVTTDFPSAYEFVNEQDGIISSLENMPDSINCMIDKFEKGYTKKIANDDNSEIITKFNSLFVN